MEETVRSEQHAAVPAPRVLRAWRNPINQEHTDAEEFVRDVAPETDRLEYALHTAAMPLARDAVARSGLAPGQGLLVPLLVPMLHGPFVFGQLRSLVRYAPKENFAAAVESHVDAGIFTRLPDGHFDLTAKGRALAEQLRRFQGQAISELWQPAAEAVGRLLPLAERLVAAAWETAGTSFALAAGVQEPADATPAHRLSMRNTALRYHRADAHAAAWAAKGLSAAQIVELTEGPEREEIEADTNRRAAPPYTALTAGERQTWLDGLRALPG